MTEVKIVIGDPKAKKSYQKAIENTLIGKKLGEKVSGDSMGIPGYEFEIRGGSDKAGFPMRSDIPGMQLKKALLTGSVGYKKKRKGLKRRKTVRGNTISEDTSQINLKIIKYGSKKIEDILGIKPKEEVKPEEKPKEEVLEKVVEKPGEKKEAPKEEVKSEEKKEEKPKEEVKSEEKKEKPNEPDLKRENEPEEEKKSKI